MKTIKQGFVNYLTLFSSMGTLICCALPALLVSLGMGAVLAGVVGQVPALVWLSDNKSMVFSFAGLMLIANGILMWRNKDAPCPLDPDLRAACITGRKTSKYVYIASVLVFIIGGLFAYVLPALMN